MILATLIGVACAQGPFPEGMVGARTNPAGLGLWGQLWWEASDTVELGTGVGVFFYWYEAQALARVTLLDGFLVLNGQLAAEPGAFKDASARDEPRRFRLRPLGRGRAELNVRNDAVWLYSRTTAWSRHRRVAEYDPFNDVVFPTGLEGTLEQATALMFSPSGAAERKVWVYGEATLEASVGIGWINRRAHLGVILEKLRPAVSVNLDTYYSFMDTAVGGPGAQVVVWWIPPRDGRRGPS